MAGIDYFVNIKTVDQLIERNYHVGSSCYRGNHQTKQWFLDLMKTSKGIKKRLLPRDQGNIHLLSTDAEDVITGPFPLPLHTDGVLSQQRVDLTILFCEEVSAKGGQTIIVPEQNISKFVKEDVFEYTCQQRDYYIDTPETWFPIPTRIKTRDGNKERLNIAFPFVGLFKVDYPSFKVRLKGKSEEESRLYFEDLTTKMLDRYTSSIYIHEWKVGDLLVIDNDVELHGRLPFEKGDKRVLIREQIIC
jgi:hypothetical protein